MAMSCNYIVDVLEMDKGVTLTLQENIEIEIVNITTHMTLQSFICSNSHYRNFIY